MREGMVEQLETAAPASKKNFFELTPKERVDLKEKVSAHGHSIRLFVHPYFNRHLGGSFEDPIDPNVTDEIVEKGFERVLLSVDPKTPPIFVMEEEGNITKFKQILDNLHHQDGHGSQMNDVYIIPTEFHDPEPKVPIGSRDLFRGAQGKWNYLIRRLEDIGVQRIMAAGMYFRKTNLGGCLGYTVKQLSKPFETKLSNFVYPITREMVKNGNEPPTSYGEEDLNEYQNNL